MVTPWTLFICCVTAAQTILTRPHSLLVSRACAADFLFGMEVYINHTAATNVRITSSGQATFYAPQLNASGLFNLSLVNPDGGVTQVNDFVFYSNDCPLEGTALCFVWLCTCVWVSGASGSDDPPGAGSRHDWLWTGLPPVSHGCLLPRRQPPVAATRLVRRLCSQTKHIVVVAVTHPHCGCVWLQVVTW